MYTSPNIIMVINSRRMRWALQVERMGEMRNACRTSVGKLEGEMPFRRPRHRLGDNIEFDLREIGWEVV
jgi:hypothetical protein